MTVHLACLHCKMLVFLCFYEPCMYDLTMCAIEQACKIFINLAETVFLARNVDEFLVYFLTLPWWLLCLQTELLPVYLCAYSGHYTYTHTYLQSAVWNHISTSQDKISYIISFKMRNHNPPELPFPMHVLPLTQRKKET